MASVSQFSIGLMVLMAIMSSNVLSAEEGPSKNEEGPFIRDQAIVPMGLLPNSSHNRAAQARSRAQRNRINGVSRSLINPEHISEKVTDLSNGTRIILREGQLADGGKISSTTVIGSGSQIVKGKNAEACSSIGSLGDETPCNE
jgi:hypothetical protein